MALRTLMSSRGARRCFASVVARRPVVVAQRRPSMGRLAPVVVVLRQSLSAVPEIALPRNVEVEDEEILTPIPEPDWHKPTTRPYSPEISLDVVSLLDAEAEAMRSVAVPWRVFCEPLRIDLLHSTVIYLRALNRPDMTAAKNRGEKRGSTRKVAPQKGRGKARVGPNRNPSRLGGGKAHAKRVRSFAIDMNKKQRKLGLRVALSQKLREGHLVVVDSMRLEEMKTKAIVGAMEGHDWGQALFVHDCVEDPADVKAAKAIPDSKHRRDELDAIYGALDVNKAFYRSVRNVPHTKIRNARNVHVFDILKFEKLVLSERAAKTLARRLDPPAYRALDRKPGATYLA